MPAGAIAIRRRTLVPFHLDQPLVLSRYLAVVDADPGWSFLSHALFGNRRIYDREAVDIARLFERPLTAREAVELAIRRGLVPFFAFEQAAGSDERLRESLSGFVRELLDCRFLVPLGEDEQRSAAERIRGTWGRDVDRAFGLDAIEDSYEPVLPLRLGALPAGQPEPVSFLLLGWCFTQTVRPLLREEARARGLEASVHVGFQDDLHLADGLKPDVTVLQLSHRQLLAPVLDHFHLLAPAALEERLQSACDRIRVSVQRALEHCTGRLLLVQGIAAPQTSPLGALDHRHPIGFFEAVACLNRAARESIAHCADALFVDEEALLSSHGKRHLLDDLVSTYSHHGPLAFEAGTSEGPSRLDSFRIRERTLLHRLLAGAYLDLYELWRGRGQIRCVAVDLDGTLWPGLIGDEDFRFDGDDLVVPLMYGRYGGLHQALQILRHRGILLAAVSRNNEADVLEKWRVRDIPLGLGVEPQDTAHYLTPEDFVALKIGWDKKSEQLAQLAAELGITPAQIAFVDDHPVEREEVRQALPEVLVLGEDMNRVREVLLSSARLEREAAARRAPSHEEFLASLGVRCTVRREAEPERIGRVAELLARTNQFNTTALRLPATAVQALAGRPDAGVLTLSVSDRFADYGLAGVAVVEGAVLSGFALSCRVIGLEAERVLLRRALELCSRFGRVARVPFVRTERNLPATRLFLTPGFEPLADGSGYGYDLERHGLPADPPHCSVVEA
jgi:HAD superfamily phosphatase (TIGR01681 family)